jgi:L-ascorbate metabolism protein UlaG (beta-lactamase superfamily)
MCVAEMLLERARAVRSRRGLFRTGAALGLAGVAMSLPPSPLLPGVAEGAQPAPSGGGPGTAGVNFKWLGTAGWEISFGNTTILADPWLTRYNTGAFSQPGGAALDPDTPITVNEPLLDQHITKADVILCGHGHFDHIPDIPYIAQKTGALVIGTETHANLLRAMGVRDDHVTTSQIMTARGGEYLEFNGYTIEVFRSLHGFLGPNKQYFFPHTLTTVPPKPTKTSDLVEGGSLVYRITVGEQFRIFWMSTPNFIEREIMGVDADLAIIAGGGSPGRYLPRLLGALNYPKYLLPSHWDNWERPLTDPPQPSGGTVQAMTENIRSVAPQSQVVVMNPLQSFAP